jgi:hypothetical protein
MNRKGWKACGSLVTTTIVFIAAMLVQMVAIAQDQSAGNVIKAKWRHLLQQYHYEKQ